MSSSFKRRILGWRMRWSRRLLLLDPSPQSFLPIQPLSHPIVMGRPFFLPQHLFPQLLPLLSLLCLHHPSRTLKNFSFPSLPAHSVLDSSSISLSSPPSYSAFLSSLTSHTSMDRPASSSSCTLTLPLPSSLPPPYSIYRPIPILLPGPLAFPWGPSLTYTLLFFPPAPCLYLIMAAPLPGSLLPPLGLPPVVPREGPLASGPGIGSEAVLETIPITPPGGNVPGLPLLEAPFPYFPPGPTHLVTEITP